MAITSISITQNNIYNGSNLIPIHSTVVFLAEVNYTDPVPDVLHVKIYNTDSELLETYKAIPYKDNTPGTRTFAFIANDPIKSLMNGFNDFFQLNNTLEFVQYITEQFNIRFEDPDNDLTFDEVLIDFVQGAAQFGENPNLDKQYNNEEDIYLAGGNTNVYVYFYNNDTNNILSINSGALVDGIAQDFDDANFTDFDDENFIIEYLN